MSKTDAIATYDGVEFQYYKFNYTNFKQKECAILRNIFEQSRNGRKTKFEGYANMTFKEGDEIQHRYPVFDVYPDFDRRNTYALVYDISEIDENIDHQWDKLIIYHYIGRSSYYGYALYNVATGKSTNTFIIDHDETELFQHISYSYRIMADKPMLDKQREHDRMIDEMVKQTGRK